MRGCLAMNEGFLIYVFFAYGLVLFAAGISITLEPRRNSPLTLARSLWWLAGFGFIHGIVEWLAMFQIMRRTGVDLPGGDLFSPLILPLLVVSGLLQAQFGASLLSSNSRRFHWIKWAPLSLLAIWLLTLWLGYSSGDFTDNLAALGRVSVRYVLYVPGAVLCALALLSQRRTFTAMRLPGLARDCVLGAAAFGFKGLIGGLGVPAVDFFPASFLNSSTFTATVGMRPEVFRAAAAVGITYFVLRMVRLFEAQRQQETDRVSYQLKRLSSQVLDAQEEERKRIARELHDDTIQLLTLLLLRLKMLERAKSPEELRERCSHLTELAAGAVDSLRRMAFELRPAALEDLGLPAAVRWYADEFAAPRGLLVEVQSSGMRTRLSPQAELGLYRVVQEALVNVTKHSGARRASVTLQQDNDGVCVLVEDDGCGFDVNEVAASRERGLGLFGMRERVTLLGGTLHIDSQPQRGTQITLKVPITDKVGTL